MRRRALLLTLLIIGTLLIIIALISAAIKTADTDVIGGADLPTYIFVFSHGNGGVYAILVLLGLATVIGATVTLVVKNKR